MVELYKEGTQPASEPLRKTNSEAASTKSNRSVTAYKYAIEVLTPDLPLSLNTTKWAVQLPSGLLFYFNYKGFDGIIPDMKDIAISMGGVLVMVKGYQEWRPYYVEGV